MGPQSGYSTSDPAKASTDAFALVREAQDNYTKGREVERDNDTRLIEDLNMYAGRQWDPKAERERKDDRRPVLTDNRFPPLIKQVTGEIQRNPFAIKCRMADGAATPDGARVHEGMIRYIERISSAPKVYTRCGQHIAQGGKGWMRLVIEDTIKYFALGEEIGLDAFDRDIKIRSIRNPVSVTHDPNAKEDDLSDMHWCIVEENMGKKEFEAAYPGKSTGGFAVSAPQSYYAWSRGDKVKIVEYWVCKYVDVDIVHLVQNKPYWSDEPTDAFGNVVGWVAPSNAQSVLTDPDPQLLEEIKTNGLDGWSVVQTRKGKIKQVCSYLLGGTEVLEGPTETPFSRIPIFRAVGEEVDIGDEVFRHGLVFHGRDNQRILNSARSYDFELVMGAPKAPYIVREDQLQGFENEWRQSIHRHLPYLRYKKTSDNAPAPKRADPIGTNPGPMALAQSAVDGIKSNVGIFDASIGQRSNETSGVAIEARDAQADTGTYVYIGNLRDTIESMGRELVYVWPKVYDTRKQITILGEDDAAEIIELDAETRAGVFKGKYAVTVRTGPSFQTQREQEEDSLIELAKTAGPEFQALYHIELAKRREGMEEFAQRLERAAIQMGLIIDENAPPSMPGGPQTIMPPGAPMPPDALSQVSPPPFVPAGRPRVGDGLSPAAPPGMMGVV